MPTYRIDRPGMDMPRVVVATMPQTARMHVANEELTVRRIEVDEAFDLAQQGVRLERAGEETPEPEFEEVDETDGNVGDNQGQQPDPKIAQQPFDAGDEELEGN